MKNPESLSSFEAYFKEYEGLFFRVACSIIRSRSDSEEAVMDTFLILHRHWERMRTMENPGGYGMRVLQREARRRRATSFWKRAVPFFNSADEDVEDSRLSGPDHQAVKSDESEAVRRQLAGLEDPYRTVIVLRLWQEMTFEEIAGYLNSKLPTVKSWYQRGVKRLAARAGGNL